MEKHDTQPVQIGGAYAILGMDLVGFSVLPDDDQVEAIEHLYRWIQEALSYHSLAETDYRWSPAGDGGYITFASTTGSAKAIDVAFSLCEKVKRPDWKPSSGEQLRIQMALHAGVIQEGRDLGRDTNIWGHGINMTARILSVAVPSQLLVSKQYADLHVDNRRHHDFTVGDVHWRTVKHGHQVEVMNVNRHDLGLAQDHARAMRWHSIGDLWTQTIHGYQALVQDTIRSGNPVAAVAAAKFLLELDEQEAVREFCKRIALVDLSSSSQPAPIAHRLFAHLPPQTLMRMIEKMQPQHLRAGEILADLGAREDTSFFIVSGEIAVEIPGQPAPKTVSAGDLIGEFNLWIPNLPRTATLRALTEVFILALPHNDFSDVLATSEDAARVVYGVIRQRIMENALTSCTLFPEITPARGGEAWAFSAECQKYAQGSQVDLDNTAYILFSGSVEIYPRQDHRLVVESNGMFGSEAVVGIVSSIGNPDGSTATVLRESVMVKIAHTDILRLHEEVPAVRNAWNGLWGQRTGEIKHLVRDDSGRVSNPDQCPSPTHAS